MVDDNLKTCSLELEKKDSNFFYIHLTQYYSVYEVHIYQSDSCINYEEKYLSGLQVTPTQVFRLLLYTTKRQFM